MHGPVAGVVGGELDGAGAADGDEDRGLGPAARLGNHAAVCLGDGEVVAVEVDGVVVHRAEIADAETDAVTLLDDERLRAGKALGVEGKDVEVGHLVGVGA